MKKICFLVSLSTAALYQVQCNDLDTIARETKTDKSSAWHNYTPVYEKQFADLRSKPIKFLEIGFYLGASARMWDQYFSRDSKLLFIDIDQNCYNYMHDLSKRCELHIVDQSNVHSLNQFLAKVGGNFDIIIDDGGHTMDQQITSFNTLFPHLKSNGIYVIEDLHTSYWQSFGSVGTQENPQASSTSTIAFLFKLIHDLNYISARTSCADKDKCPQELLTTLSYYQKNIAAIYFYTSLCFIVKR